MTVKLFAVTRAGSSLHDGGVSFPLTKCGFMIKRRVREMDALKVAQDCGWFGSQTFRSYIEEDPGILCLRCFPQ